MKEVETENIKDRLMMLNSDQKKDLASFCNIDINDKNIDAKLHKILQEEQELVDKFKESHPDFIKNAQNALSYILKKYQVNEKNCSEVTLGGNATSYLEIINSPLHSIAIQSHRTGFYDKISDKSFVLLDQKRVNKLTEENFTQTYLHEALHGAGYRQENGKPRGIESRFLQEAIVDNLANIYTASIFNDKNQFKSVYSQEINLFKSLSKHIPENIFYQAHFHGKKEDLKNELENVYGEGAYKLFVENSDFYEAEELNLFAKNWKECNYLLNYNKSNEKINPSEINKQTMDKLLELNFRKKIKNDINDLENQELGSLATDEGKEKARNYLSEKYPEKMVNLLFDIASFKSVDLENNIIIKNFIDYKINQSYKE